MFGISRIKKHVYKQDREKGELWAQTLGVSRAEQRWGGGPLDHTCQSAWPRAIAP